MLLHYLRLVNIFISIWYSVGMIGRWFGLSIDGILTLLCRLLEIWHHHSHCPRRPHRRHALCTPMAPQSLPARTRLGPLLVDMSVKILVWCYRIAASKSKQWRPLKVKMHQKLTCKIMFQSCGLRCKFTSCWIYG